MSPGRPGTPEPPAPWQNASVAASAWPSTTTHPDTYPGGHPRGGYVVVDDRVVDIEWPHRAERLGDGEGTLDPFTARLPGGESLNGLLAGRSVPVLQDRIPVLAYGATRNPAFLLEHLSRHRYAGTGRGLVLPALRATLRGFDVVGGNLAATGHLSADLVGGPASADTEVAVHVLLVDRDQLRVLSELHRLEEGGYEAVLLGPLTLASPGQAPRTARAVAFVGAHPAFVSPLTGTPLAFESTPATARGLPAFGALDMLAHALEATGLLEAVAAAVRPGGPPGPPADVAADLMTYLNGQWWWARHTGRPRLAACERLEEAVRGRLREFSWYGPVHERLNGQDRPLGADELRRPGAHLGFAALLDG